MQPLDLETADYIAATVIREALLHSPECHFVTVEATVSALFEAGLIDLKCACYVTLGAERFSSLPAPQLFDANWHSAAESLQNASKTASAHPFLT